jgi:hypothetical protein
LLPDEDRARGLMLGLLVGDASAELAGDALMHGTCLSQLACFTVEGYIRGSIRAAEKGIGDPINIAWSSMGRWARAQGLNPTNVVDYGPSSGWLSDVAPLTVRRGSAPSTVRALETGPGTRRMNRPGFRGGSISMTEDGVHGRKRAVAVSA